MCSDKCQVTTKAARIKKDRAYSYLVLFIILVAGVGFEPTNDGGDIGAGFGFVISLTFHSPQFVFTISHTVQLKCMMLYFSAIRSNLRRENES